MERLQIDIHKLDKLDGHNSCPIIVGKIDMCSVRFLIDTGASLSYIDKSFVKKHPLLSNFVEVTDVMCVTNMVGGVTNSCEVLNTENLIFKTGKYSGTFNLIDLNQGIENEDIIYDSILGLDFLLSYGIKLDFSRNTFTI